MTETQQDAIYAAYLGVCVLRSMTRKVNLTLATQRCSDVLTELSEAFPFISERVALSSLRDKSKANPNAL